MATASHKKGRSSGHVLENVDHKECVDDTIPLTATIVTYKILQSHVEYTIRVHRGPNSEEYWDVNRRYNEFGSLNQTLQISGATLPLPPKKMFGNTDKQFLNERQQGLQLYLNLVVKDPFIAASLALKKFLDPTTYSQDYHETALRNVSMFFRSNPEWGIVDPLRDIGWRINKHYYLIGSKIDSSTPHRILTWITPGPDFCVSDRDLELLLKILVDLKHVNIQSPTSATFNGSGLLVTRNYYPNGSLRDKIYKTKPSQHYLTNYSGPSSGLGVSEIQRYGRQILDTLQFLMQKGFVLGHIHSGNVFIEDGICKLVDLENCLMGLPVFHRAFLLDLRKVQGPETEAVYCFGHLIYEMACGVVLKTAVMETTPVGLPPELISVLECILSPVGVKSPPSISDLIVKPFFSGVPSVTVLEKPSLKVPTRLKEVVQSIREKVDSRLQENQRKVSQFRRMSKAHESLMSEEEKKKRRKKIRKQMTQEAEQQKESDSYYPTSKLKKQLTVPSSQTTPVASSNKSAPTTKTNNTANSSNAHVPPPPPTSQPPQPQTSPSKTSGERGALLSSIEAFSKGKLKKAITNDRSAPKI